MLSKLFKNTYVTFRNVENDGEDDDVWGLNLQARRPQILYTPTHQQAPLNARIHNTIYKL